MAWDVKTGSGWPFLTGVYNPMMSAMLKEEVWPCKTSSCTILLLDHILVDIPYTGEMMVDQLFCLQL